MFQQKQTQIQNKIKYNPIYYIHSHLFTKKYLKNLRYHQLQLNMKNRYTLKSQLSFYQVNNSHTNKSKSKQTYAFSKSPRFQNPQPKYFFINISFQIVAQNNLIKVIFFTCKITIKLAKKVLHFQSVKEKDQILPKVQQSHQVSLNMHLSQYLQKTIMKKKQRGIRCGQAEKQIFILHDSQTIQKVLFGSYLNKQLLSIPSPDKYNPNKNQMSRSPSYSLRPKTKIIDKRQSIEPQNKNPGPGQYENPQIHINSKYSSKFSTIGYSNSKSKRFDGITSITPGPGNYKDILSMSKVGRYVVSNHVGGTKAIFDHTRRVSKFEEIQRKSRQKPGPGSYRTPSEFGQYDDSLIMNGNDKMELNSNIKLNNESKMNSRVSSRRRRLNSRKS